MNAFWHRREPAVTAKALRASIEAWEKKLAEVDPDNILIGSDVCPLCQLYDDDDCCGCPVMEETGLSGCRGTPFREADKALDAWIKDATKRPAFLRAAQAEIEFLKSLENPS